MLSLKDILMKKISADSKQIVVESYIWLSNVPSDKEDEDNCENDQVIIVKRMNLTFYG